MNIKTDDINATRKTLVVTVNAEEIENEHNAVLGDFAKEARLPGFRPGRAPKPMVAKRFAKEINEEVKKRVISNAYREAIKESGVEVFRTVDLKGEDIERGRDNELTFVVDIHPQFNLPEYKGIPMEKPDTAVTDEEVERTLETLREQRADYSVVEREAQKGDYVKLSYEGKIGEQPISEIAPDRPIFGSQKNTWEEVGSDEGGIPGFAEQLAEIKAGETKEIKVTFPEDFAHEALAGKEAAYSVEMIEVREKTLPEIDEEFLKGLNVESLDQLKEQIGKELAGRKESDGHARQRQQLGDTLLERIEFAVPESAIDMETEGLMRQIIERNVRQGVSEEELEKHKEQIYEESRKSAVKRIKLRMILMKIAEAENIKLENEDVQRHLMQEAMQRGMRPDDVVKEMRKDEHMVQAMRQNILFDKTLDFLLREANLSESQK